MTTTKEEHSTIPETGMTTRAKRAKGPSLWLGLHFSGRAVFLAGLGAGIIFLMLELLTAFVFGAGTPFGPAHVMLQGLAGAEGLPGQYNLGLVVAGLFVHFFLSVLVLIPLAVFIHPWKRSYLVAAVGFLYGCMLYFINFTLFALALPLLTSARDVFMLGDYTLFGLAAAWLYVTLRDRAAEQ